MKKKAVKSKKISRTIPKTRKYSTSTPSVITLRRIIFITACVTVFAFAFVITNKHAVTQSVAGMSIARGLFDQATVQLPNVPGASTYNIYYKAASDSTFDHAVSNIPAIEKSYTISYLKKNTIYEYKIYAADKTGSEFWWSPVSTLTNIESM